MVDRGIQTSATGKPQSLQYGLLLHPPKSHNKTNNVWWKHLCWTKAEQQDNSEKIRHLVKVKSRTTAPSGFLQDISSLCSVKCPTISSALCHNGRHILRNHSHFYGEVSSMKVQMFMHAHMSFTVMCVLNVVVLEPGWVPVCGVQGSGVSPWHFRVTANTVSHWCWVLFVFWFE